MRMHHPFDEVFGRRSKVALMRYLITSQRQTTGRDLARSVGLDHRACRDSLTDLVREGIVRERSVGRASFFTLNADYPLVREILIPMFEWERGLFARMARDLRKALGPNALSIFLFGSTAKGTDTMRSDIDVLVVVREEKEIPAIQEKGLDAGERLRRNYSRVMKPGYMDVRTFRRLFMKNDYFLMEILRSGRLLDGLRDEELLNLGRPKNRPGRSPAR